MSLNTHTLIEPIIQQSSGERCTLSVTSGYPYLPHLWYRSYTRSGAISALGVASFWVLRYFLRDIFLVIDLCYHTLLVNKNV